MSGRDWEDGQVDDLILFALVAQLVFWAWGLADALSYSSEQWRSIGRSRTNWVFWVAIFGPLGAVAYLLGPHKALGHMEPANRTQPDRRA